MIQYLREYTAVDVQAPEHQCLSQPVLYPQCTGVILLHNV